MPAPVDQPGPPSIDHCSAEAAVLAVGIGDYLPGDELVEQLADLAAVKARGVRLGNPKIEEARHRALATIRGEADRAATNVLPIISDICDAGAKTLQEIATAWNERGVTTSHGGHWHATSVKSVLARA
jgi:hypothetical protein